MVDINKIDEIIRKNAKIEIGFPRSRNINMLLAIFIVCIKNTKRDEKAMQILLDLHRIRPLSYKHTISTLEKAYKTETEDSYTAKLLKRMLEILKA